MIGVFDSGIGGLSIWKGVVEKIPNVSTMYVADQGWAPYGNRPISDIQNRGYKISAYLRSKGARVIVVACNTATVNITVDHLREKFKDVAFVGVEPPVKKLSEITKTKKIGIFATKATCESSRLAYLIEEFSVPMNVEVEVIPTIEWAKLVEDNFPEPETKMAIKKYVSQLSKNVDVVGLGCTHYPFLRKRLEELKPGVVFIDVVSAVAKQTENLYKYPPSQNPEHTFLTTGGVEALQTPLKDLLSVNSPVKSVRL